MRSLGWFSEAETSEWHHLNVHLGFEMRRYRSRGTSKTSCIVWQAQRWTWNYLGADAPLFSDRTTVISEFCRPLSRVVPMIRSSCSGACFAISLLWYALLTAASRRWTHLEAAAASIPSAKMPADTWHGQFPERKTVQRPASSSNFSDAAFEHCGSAASSVAPTWRPSNYKYY